MYNEEAVAEWVVFEIQKVLGREKIDYELILVNNGSKDRTGNVLENLIQKDHRIKLIHIKENEGYGWGIISGLKNVRGDVVGYSDGDGQIDPEDIIKVYNNLKISNSDLCKGTRCNREDGYKRVVASYFFNQIFNKAFSIPIKDVNGKPKIFKREILDNISLKSKDWFIDAELMMNLFHKGYKSNEVMIKFRKRTVGKSYVSFNAVREFTQNMIKWKLALWKNKKL